MMPEADAVASTLSALRHRKRALIIAHRAPDGDTLGSALALASLLKRLGAQTTLVCHDDVPVALKSLPGVEQFVLPALVPAQRFDLAVAVDSSDMERLGDAAQQFTAAPVTVQIDHHPTNVMYAQHNLLVSAVPATACIIYRLFEEAGLPFTREEAICLYAGISTDTGSFCFGSLTEETFRQVAGLMAAGLPLAETARQLHLMRQKDEVFMLGRALNSLRFFADGQVSGMRLSKADFLSAGVEKESADGVVNYGLYLPGVRMCYLASETSEGIKVSLRALPPCDVSGIAASFGGGGHVLAAGCTIDAPLDEAERRVREALIAALPS